MNHRLTLSCAIVLAAGVAAAQDPRATTPSTSATTPSSSGTPQMIAEIVSIDTAANSVTVRHVLVPSMPNSSAAGTVTLVVAPDAMASIARFHAGDQVAVSCRAAAGGSISGSTATSGSTDLSGTPGAAASTLDVHALCPTVVALAQPTESQLRAMGAAPSSAGTTASAGSSTTAAGGTAATGTTAAPAGKRYAVEVVATDTAANTVTVKAAARAGASPDTSTSTQTVMLAVQGKALATLTSLQPGDRVTITCAPDTASPTSLSSPAPPTNPEGAGAQKPRAVCPAVVEMAKSGATQQP